MFAGEVDGGSEPVPEAGVLRRWADELGVDLDPSTATWVAPGAVRDPAADGDDDLIDIVVRIASIKNFVSPDGLAPAVGSSVDEVAAALQQLVAEGLAEERGRMHRLSHNGLDRASQLLASDQTKWGIASAETALDELHALDLRMKQIVTLWQIRSVDGTEALNDHTDEVYDREVLAALGAVHDEVGPWVRGLATGLPRLDRYRRRLDEALERAMAGDERYVAGPMLESYHTVWFELHEDLIRLAGRTRKAEAAAGRA